MHSGRIAPPLSPEERALFDNFGYLLLRGFLPRDAVRWLLEIVDRVCEAERVRQGLGLQDFVEVRNAVAKDHELLALVDWPEMLSIITELMGVELQLNTSHAMVRPPQPPDTPESFKAIAWHRDGHQNIPVVHGTTPWLYTKVGYFLTDMPEPGMGNLRLVPGSHLRAEFPAMEGSGIDPANAIEVCASAGDAVLFQQRMWHAVGPNYSPATRKNLYMGYGYRWLRPLDYIVQSPELLDKATPVQRQLLGEPRSEMTFWLPKPDELPLARWAEARQQSA